MKKFLFALGLLIATKEMHAKFEHTDMIIAACVIGASWMSDEAQKAELKKDARQYPEQRDIYLSDNLNACSRNTNAWSALSIAGIVICRFLGLDPNLTGIALAGTGVSAIMTRQRRLSIEDEAELERFRLEKRRIERAENEEQRQASSLNRNNVNDTNNNRTTNWSN